MYISPHVGSLGLNGFVVSLIAETHGGPKGFTAFTDIFLAVAPIFAFWKLQLKPKAKILLVLLFSSTTVYVEFTPLSENFFRPDASTEPLRVPLCESPTCPDSPLCKTLPVRPAPAIERRYAVASTDLGRVS